MNYERKKISRSNITYICQDCVEVQNLSKNDKLLSCLVFLQNKITNRFCSTGAQIKSYEDKILIYELTISKNKQFKFSFYEVTN